MYYVIVREDGMIASRPGSRRSYTSSLFRARIWRSRQSAERNRCGNERIVDVMELLDFFAE